MFTYFSLIESKELSGGQSSDARAGNQWVEIAFQAIWERLLWVVFCLSQLYYLTGSF